jgi:LysM repeat protein
MSMLAAGVVVLAAGCGDDGAAPTISTIAVTSTAYVTIPARTTTSTVAPADDDDAEADDDAVAAVEVDPADDPTRERIHVIEAGDVLVVIARDFDVPVDHLVSYNGWTDGLRHALMPGDEIRIPPSDYDPDGVASTDGTAQDGSVVGECPDGEPQETYTIRRGDIPARVAEDHDTTVEELDAANDGVVGYPGFVVGIEINIPC